jgi:mono/diheme cytochrome c family protein
MPVSETTFPPGAGSEIATSQCLICHSAGMILRQPPLTQEQWLAEINKMRAAFGALIPVDQVDALARYLSGIRLANSKGT